MAALALNPPHPKLTWAQIVEYTTIAKFELLCMGVWMTFAIWSGPIPGIVRPLSVISQLLHAQEENTHLNVEIKRLATWLVDEPLNWTVPSSCAYRMTHSWLLQYRTLHMSASTSIGTCK